MKPPPAECPGCGQNTRRLWKMKGGVKIGLMFRSHSAPCGLPCKTVFEALNNELTHTITEECPQCRHLQNVRRAQNKILVDGKVYDREEDPRRAQPQPKKVKPPPIPPSPKTPWDKIVIPPHALKMMKIRAGFYSVVDAANMIERLYPLAVYKSSQKEAQGTSHTKRTMPGKNKKKSQRVDLYSIEDAGIVWTFYMKRNVLMTVHRNDDLDNIGALPSSAVLEATRK